VHDAFRISWLLRSGRSVIVHCRQRLQTPSRNIGHGVDFDVRSNFDVAVGSFGIWTLEVSGIHQSLRGFALNAREIDVEPSLKKVTASSGAQIHFGVNGSLWRQFDFLSGGHDLER
jgi:hypothetical protein